MVADDGNILNLARFRKIAREDQKKRDKSAKESRSTANRVKFGRSGLEKKQEKLLAERQEKLHEAHRRNDSSSKPVPDDKNGD